MNTRKINRRSSNQKKQKSSLIGGWLPQSGISAPMTDQRSLHFESLEDRVLLAAFLFVDYGDNFPAGTLTTTQGAFRDVANDAVPANRILGTTLVDSADNFAAGKQLDIVAQVFTANERAQMLAVIQRAYLPLDLTVVELTASAQMTSDGRNVAGASSMADVINTLRAGNAAFRDAYVFVGTFIVDPGGATQQTYTGGGGLSPEGTILGEMVDLSTAANNHDDVAVVYSSGGLSNNTLNNISHEAGHLFGLRHAITNATPTTSINLFHQAEIMSYRNTNNTTSSMFTRFPMIRGDGNSPVAPPNPVNYNDLAARAGQVTTFDQLRFDGNVGANPNFTFVSGTGAHDIITITRNGANADVTIQAFADAAYTTAITVPGEADTTFSYSIPLTTTILVYAGDSNDQIIINGDLGVAVQIDGMLGTDTLIVNGSGAASATYAPAGTAPNGVDMVFSFGGTVTFASTSIVFGDFETAGSVTLQNIGTVTFVSPGGADALTMDSPLAGQSRIAGSTSGISLVPLLFFNVTTVNVDAGFGEGAGAVDVILVNSLTAAGLSAVNITSGGASDILTIAGLNPLPGQLTFDGQGGSDLINGPNTPNVWVINGANSGQLSPSAVEFLNVENINGGSTTDNFVFLPLGGLAGIVDGNAGIDVLNFGLLGSVQTTLTGLGSGGGANGFDGNTTPITGGFRDIDELIGSSVGAFDELKGINGPAQWFYTGVVGTYVFNSRTFTFSNLEVLTGGSAIERFTFKPLTTNTLFINGNLPSVLPGDLLRVDLVGVSNPQLFVTSPGNGIFTFDPPHQPILYTSIERLDVFDYGDAPNSYGTNGGTGAKHRLGSNLKLGSALDPEPNGQASAMADRDDLTGTPDDEDGVVLPTNLVAEFRGAVIVNASGSGKLDAWIDFNANGTFDVSEQIATSVPVVAGNNRIEFSVPGSAVAGSRFARFRLSVAGGLGPTGLAESGEVEDYRVPVVVLNPGTVVVLDDPLAPGESKKMLFVAGTSSNDEIIVEPYFDDNVRVVLTGRPIFGPAPLAPIQRFGVLGGAGNDRLIINNELTIPAEIYGNSGNDLILSGLGDDFLDGGYDDDVIYGYNGKDMIYGQSGSDVLYGMGGADVLLGGAGDDLMYGGGGRDLLIGGTGLDRLFGETGDDLLIGGTTSYDSNWVALGRLSSEWYSARSYNDRVFNLRTGNGPILGGSSLNFSVGTTVFGDGVEDRLYGGSDRDWFYQIDGADTLPDLEDVESVN